MTKKWLAILCACALLSSGVALADATSERAQQILNSMTVEQKVYQMFMIRPESLTGADNVTAAGKKTREALSKYPVAGIIYFAANLETKSQTREMIQNVQSYAYDMGAPRLFIGVDEEGGRVSRVGKKLGTTKFPPMKDVGATGDPENAYHTYQTIGSDIRPLGFNLDLAPVADVITNNDNVDVNDRSFGTDPDLVSEMVARAVQGLHDEGVMACLKHFPGSGNTKEDPHYTTAITDRSIEQLREVEFLPFKAGIEAGADMVMVSHVTAAGVDGSAPSCMNRHIVTDLLRGELGYDGVVLSDALEMKAITNHYSVSEIAVSVVNAGVDILLMPDNFKSMSSALLKAVEDGTIPESRLDESVLRILSLKLKYSLEE